jgi:anti-sigma B factor antagonist
MWKKFNLEGSMVQAGDVEVCRVRIDGYLDSSTFPKLQDYLNEQFENEKYNYLLDLKDLDYISSAGLGVLMSMLRQVRQKNGDLKIVNMSEKIHRVFNLLGFSRLMQVYHSEEEALEAFKEMKAGVDPGGARGDEEY